MQCLVLKQLASTVSAAAALPIPTGLGAGPVLTEQVRALAGAVARLERELAVRMAALERDDPATADPRGEAASAGVGSRHAAQLRTLGRFADEHPDLLAAWTDGTISIDQVLALHNGAHRLPTPQLRQQLVALLVGRLPGVDITATRQLVGVVVDQLHPGDPDADERSEHAARNLSWALCPRGGIAFQGYLPAAEAESLRAAIDALVEELRAAGDSLTPGQRRADALAALVDRARMNRTATGGGIPAALTLTVSLSEAARIARRNPSDHGGQHQPRPYGGATLNGHQVGDATVRFGMCCAAITPILHDSLAYPSSPAPASLLGRLARTKTQPLAVGRAVRLATPAQRQALQVRDGGCVIPGCTIPAPYTQPHHVTGWAIGGTTDLDNLASLCFVHHRATELGRYTFAARQPGQPKPPGTYEHPNWWITPPFA